MTIAGPNASSIISNGIHLIAIGTIDYILNYYPNPLLKRLYTPDQFSDILIGRCSNFIQASHFQPCDFFSNSHIFLPNFVPFLINFCLNANSKLANIIDNWVCPIELLK